MYMVGIIYVSVLSKSNEIILILHRIFLFIYIYVYVNLKFDILDG